MHPPHAGAGVRSLTPVQVRTETGLPVAEAEVAVAVSWAGGEGEHGVVRPDGLRWIEFRTPPAPSRQPHTRMAADALQTDTATAWQPRPAPPDSAGGRVQEGAGAGGGERPAPCGVAEEVELGVFAHTERDYFGGVQRTLGCWLVLALSPQQVPHPAQPADPAHMHRAHTPDASPKLTQRTQV